jgi:hypothetical protein
MLEVKLRNLKKIMMTKTKTTTHYYILPDGRIAENMKEACEMMGINRRSFQNLVKKETITKHTNLSKLQEDENNRQTD